MSKISEHYSEMQIKTIGLDREQHRKQRRGKRVQSFLRPPENRRIRTKNSRYGPTRPQIKRVALGENRGPSGKKFPRMDTLEKFLSIWEFRVEKNDGPNDQILTIEDGELKTANEFDYYSSDQNALKLGRTLIS